MSTQITSIQKTGKTNDVLEFTQTAGPDGVCIQLTQGNGLTVNTPGYITLTLLDAYKTIDILASWIKTVTKNKADTIQKEIDRNEALKKTIFQDAVDCQHFINDLETLEIPLILLS